MARYSCLNYSLDLVRYIYYELFFISRNFCMTPTGSERPTFFCISGSCSNVSPYRQILAVDLTETRINTLCFYIKISIRSLFVENYITPTFSSPMVNFPCVSLFSDANFSSFLTASSWEMVTPNFTLPLVYSWPGYGACQRGQRQAIWGILHRLWCRPANLLRPRSKPCASQLLCPRRSDHSLATSMSARDSACKYEKQ